MKGSATDWEGWQKRRKIGRRKVSKSLSAVEVGHMFKAWHFAEQIKQPCNRLVTIRPRVINELSPAERITYFEGARNKIAQFARDNRFEHVSIWSRESTRNTGEDEHLHLLTHIPSQFLDRFDDIGSGWYGGTDEIDIRQSDYRIKLTPSGRRHSAITYLAKNAPGIASRRGYTYRLGGPILGKRAGLSRNLSPKAQARHEARHLIRSEFDHERAIRQDLR